MNCSTADRRSPLGLVRGHSAPRVYNRVVEMMRARQHSVRTQQTYCRRVKRFIYFHNVRRPSEVAEPEINAFLTHLAVKEKVSASTQNQALLALLFLYRHLIGCEVGDLGEVIRARKHTCMPVVMTRQGPSEVRSPFDGL